jgi:S-adenosylmethionine decarboxylase
MKISPNPRLSRHCLATLVTKDPDILFELEPCKQRVLEIIKEEEIDCLAEVSHQFHNKSFTVVAALAESHISLHTWPERHVVQLDVFLCNYMQDNTEKCRRIFDKIVAYFDPVEVNETVIERL